SGPRLWPDHRSHRHRIHGLNGHPLAHGSSRKVSRARPRDEGCDKRRIDRSPARRNRGTRSSRHLSDGRRGVVGLKAETLSIRVEPEPNAAALSRVFVGNVLVIAGSTEQDIDDVRIAVSDLTSGLVEAGTPIEITA